MTTTITTTKIMTTKMRTTTTTKQQQQQKQNNNNKKQQKKYQRYNNKNNNKKNKNNNQPTTQTTTTVPWLCFSLPFWGGLRPPQPPLFFFLWHLLRHFCLKGTKKLSCFFALLKVSFLKHSLFEKKWWPPIFSGNAIKIGVLENFEKPVFFWKKWWNYFLPVLKAPHFLGVTFFLGLFSFLLFFCFFCI